MKIHNNIYKSLTGEPFHTQQIDNKKVEFFYLNDTRFLSQYVQRGRFYLWTSNGADYRLVVEKGFYDKVSYFFEDEINSIWVNFLEEVGRENAKMSKIFLLGSLGISLVIMVATYLINQDLVTYGVIAALFVVLVANIIHTSKVKKFVQARNYQAQVDIKAVLKEDGFERLLKDQDEYYQKYFEFDEQDDFDGETEELETVEIEEVIEIEETITEQKDKLELKEEALVVKEVVAKDKPKNKKVDYNNLTVPQLRSLAKELGLSGYSTLNKADLIKLVSKKK